MRTANSKIETDHQAWIEVQLDNLEHNLKRLEKAYPQATQTLAVIKANAYGHGLNKVGDALTDHVEYLGVTSYSEAMELRENECNAPIFIFGKVSESEMPSAIIEGFTFGISNYQEAKDLSDAAESFDQTVTVHIKIDTGMGRLGIPFRDAIKAIEKIATLKRIELEGIYTHFPTAECDDGFSEKQLSDFSLIVQALEKKGISFQYKHAANSTGILKCPNPLLNMARPGIMLYGIYPAKELRKDIALKPILSFRAKIIASKRLRPGESAGYGREFIADKHTTIAVIPVGYSHGYPFAAWKNAEVLFRGKRYPLAGRISMDFMTINLGDDSAMIGETVTLIGSEREEEIRVEDIAEWSQTIPYEIMTRLLPSIPRYYS